MPQCLLRQSRVASVGYLAVSLAFRQFTIQDLALEGTLLLGCNLLGVSMLHRIQTLPDLRGDERMVKQIVLNLLTNALKFTQPGGTVAVRAGDAAEGADDRIAG